MDNRDGLCLGLKIAWIKKLHTEPVWAALYETGTGIDGGLNRYTPIGEVRGINYPPGGVRVSSGFMDRNEKDGVVMWHPGVDVVFEALTIEDGFDTVLFYTPTYAISLHTFGEQTLNNEDFILRIPVNGLIRIKENYK